MASEQLRSIEFDAPPRTPRRIAGRSSSHDVQFYESDAYLAEAVSDYLARGLIDGQRCIVIATQRHRLAFSKALRNRGVDVVRARGAERLLLLDARKTLASIMDGQSANEAKFRRVIAPLFERTGGRSSRIPVRAYGEMVNLLWQDGNRTGAIALESLWNDLGAVCDLELLCGYAMTNFGSANDAREFEAICAQHAHVAPTESYSRGDKIGRLLEITRLQQRARALENEVVRREMLERQLREAIEEQERSLDAERAARAEAEVANRAKNQFLAVMSHELRTPLNAIAGHTQLLDLGLHGPITDAQRDALDRIDRSQRHLLSLVNDVLNLAHIESGRAEFLFEHLEVAPLIHSIVAMIEPLLATAQLECRVVERVPDHDMAPRAIWADREKVQQILLNLLTNAIKFTPAGGRITIDATCACATDLACIEVRDTGVGIPAEKIDAVFEPFVQLATKFSSRQDGIGLGLTISRQFARGMHGDLVVASDAAEGACFRLTLPLAQPPA